MLHLLWDASALAKRYYREIGTDTVDAVFAAPDIYGVITVLGFAETHAILVRKRNGGTLSPASYRDAVSALRLETGSNLLSQILHVPFEAIMAGISLVARHNLNSSDAAILTSFLRYAAASGEQTCILVASDRRLLRAAREEGLRVLNPESVAAEEVPSLLRAWG